MLFVIYNPFNDIDDENVSVEIIDNGNKVILKTPTQIIFDNDINYYRYIIDEKPRCAPNKLICINKNGEEYHYIYLKNKQLPLIYLNHCISIGDKDILFSIHHLAENKEKKKELLIASAESGHSHAAYLLGLQCLEMQNKTDAITYFTMAINNSLLRNSEDIGMYYYNLGLCYTDEINKKRAIRQAVIYGYYLAIGVYLNFDNMIENFDELFIICKSKERILTYIYNHIKYNKYDKHTEKLYLILIENGRKDLKCELALHYCNNLKDYKNAKKWWMDAIDEDDNIESMFLLGEYYRLIEHNYPLMKWYLSMAMAENYGNAMLVLATYYKEIENNPTESTRYMNMVTQDNISTRRIGYIKHSNA